MVRPPRHPPLLPYTTLFRSNSARVVAIWVGYAPIGGNSMRRPRTTSYSGSSGAGASTLGSGAVAMDIRSEEHTSELQSHVNLVCRLLLEKKKKLWGHLTGRD